MKTRILITLGLATLLASAAQASQEQLAKSIGDVRVETAKTAEQLKATLKSLNALTKQSQGDLRPAYNTFTAEVGKTVSAAAVTRARVKWMASDGREYFKDWQKTVDGISNESLRKKAQKRLNSARGNYDKVEESLVEASEKFKPFLSDLSDIEKALAADVTAGGVKAIRGTVSSANWDHKFVERAINSALKSQGKMEKALSTAAQ